MSSFRTAILIPTYPSYRVLAEYTAKEIRKKWDNCPDLYLAGCHGIRTEGWLVCRDETASWIDILLEALHQLVQERGYESIYIILDDHPPLGKCHEDHLNVTLPSMLKELGATCICLLGCDQGQGRVGEKLDRQRYQMEKINSSYKYVFSLHPALWDGKKLIEILRKTKQFALENDKKLSPWTFEKTALENPYFTDEEKENCYRVSGSQMSRRKNVWMFLRWQWKSRIFLKKFGLDIFKDLEYWYEGPYPHIWSGVMRSGAESDLYERVLRKYADLESKLSYTKLQIEKQK